MRRQHLYYISEEYIYTLHLSAQGVHEGGRGRRHGHHVEPRVKLDAGCVVPGAPAADATAPRAAAT
jgi:hypothetical protein